MEKHDCDMKQNGVDYKESSVKSIWNITAQILQYYKVFNIKIVPFTDIVFNSALLANYTKRKQLQGIQKEGERHPVGL